MSIQERLHQYSLLIRWHRPIPILLMLWPTLTALFIATQGHPPAKLLFVFVAGVFVMRSAGCIINDMLDIKFDKYVARTQMRPLTSSAVKIPEAFGLLAVLLLIALGLLFLLNRYCFVLACIGVILTCIYPLMKRFIDLPQGVLGIVYNWGVPMAFAASNNVVPFTAWFLFFIAIVWTIVYDTMYAMCDRADDLKIGIKSSAIWFDMNDRMILAGLQGLVIVCLCVLGLLLKANAWFYLSIFAVIFSFLYQQYLIRDRNESLCLAAFNNNQWSWFFVFFGVLLNYLK